MTFQMDTGWKQPDIQSVAGSIPDDQNVRFTNYGQAQNKFNRIKENIEIHETVDALDDYWERESVIIDALYLFDSALCDALQEAYDDQRIMLRGSEEWEAAQADHARPALPDNDQSAKVTNMTGFNMDTGPGGAEGPWISWSARGTQDGVIPAKSFFIRDGEDKAVLEQFVHGVVLDIDTMRTGWQHSEGIIGQAPDWRWNPSIAVFAAQPGDDWKKGFEVRVAIGGGKTATWQQAGAGAWNAFVALVPALQQQPQGKLPMIRMTGTKAVQFKKGSTVEPVLEVVKWVDRPECLDASTAIATEPAPAPAPAPQQKAVPAPAAAVPADIEF